MRTHSGGPNGVRAGWKVRVGFLEEVTSGLLRGMGGTWNGEPQATPRNPHV